MHHAYPPWPGEYLWGTPTSVTRPGWSRNDLRPLARGSFRAAAIKERGQRVIRRCLRSGVVVLESVTTDSAAARLTLGRIGSPQCSSGANRGKVAARPQEGPPQSRLVRLRDHIPTRLGAEPDDAAHRRRVNRAPCGVSPSWTRRNPMISVIRTGSAAPKTLSSVASRPPARIPSAPPHRRNATPFGPALSAA